MLVDLDLRMLQIFFQCKIQNSRQNKNREEGDDKIKTVTSDGTQQNKNTDVTNGEKSRGER